MVGNAASKSRTRPARIGQIGGTHDMRNTGTPPRHASVDIRLRNGSVHRGINPKDWRWKPWRDGYESDFDITSWRSEEHTSELQSLMRISYAVFCLNKKNKTHRLYKYKNSHK